MVDVIRNTLARLRDALPWAPHNVTGAIILALAAALALVLHAAAARLIRRLVQRQQPYLAGILAGTRHLSQIAFLIAALFIALPVAPFSQPTAIAIASILLITAIILVGWTAITVSHILADLYLLKFRLDVADNLLARKHVTQVRVLRRVVDTLLIIVTIGAVLMTFEPVRQYGVSLFASAGVAGLVAGLAARPVLSNLIAGIQLAVTQPIRLEDAVVIENESGRIEEITSTYVVVRLWDMRRLIVPLTYFIEKPFQNWTRDSANQIGPVLLNVDYTTPVDRLRAKAEEIVKASPMWDGSVVKLHVTDADATSMQVRVIASARSSGDAFELRCEIREKLIDFLQRELPDALPRQRQQTIAVGATAAGRDTSSPSR